MTPGFEKVSLVELFDKVANLPYVMMLSVVCGRPRCPQDPNFTTSLANFEEIIIMKMMIIAS